MIEFALTWQLAIWLAVSVWFVTSRSASMFHPLTYYLLFHGIVFVARPIMVHTLGFENQFTKYGYFPDQTAFSVTLLVATVGLLAIAAALWFFGYRRPVYRDGSPVAFTPAEKKGFVVAAAIVLPVALYAATVRWSPTSFDGSSAIQMVRDPVTAIPVYVNTTGYLLEAQRMIVPLAVLFIWINRFRLWSFAPLIADLAYRSFLGWSRNAFVIGLGTLVLLYLYDNRRRWLGPAMIVAAIPVAVVFQMLGRQRDLVRMWLTGETPYSQSANRTLGEMLAKLDNADFSHFEALAFVIDVVPDRAQTYSYFSQYLQLFTEPIPRIWWPDKPIGPPLGLVNMHAHGQFTGNTISLVGDGWMSAGWFGVIATMLIVGVALGVFHRWFWARQESRFAVLCYCLLLPLSVLFFRDGGIGVFKQALFALVPILIWRLATRAIEARAPWRPAVSIAER